MARAAQHCRGCPLYRGATQAVFGEGPREARPVLVGEQPGDREDREGHPFTGPAGQPFDRALAAAGIARSATYVTNVVKHFKWKSAGKRRLHQRPDAREVRACRPSPEAELARLKPRVIVCLGAAAAQALPGGRVRA